MSKHRRIGRSWISLLLVLVMTMQLLPVSVIAAEVTEGTVTAVAQGNCGPADESGVNADNARWVLTSDGTLTISGIGQVDHAPAWNIDTTPIKSVVIGEGISEIVSQVDWRNAETLSLPASLTGFDAEIIRGCGSLKSITLAEGSATYKMLDGTLMSKDGTVLCWHPRNASSSTTYNVPNGVKTIGDYALYSHSSLRTISLPDGLVTIGKHAFNSCGNLNCTLTIPATVKVMGDYCLSYNNELKIVIPADSVLETIGEGAMSDNYTEELTLPATLKSVGTRALPFGMKTGAVLTFLSRTVTFEDDAIYQGSTVYGYPGSTAEAYANAVNSNEKDWDNINFILLDVTDSDLSGLGKTIGFLPGLLTGSAPNYATELSGSGSKTMGFVGEKAGISLVSGSVNDEKDTVLTKLSFKLQLQAHLADTAQAIPQPTFVLSSAKDAGTTLSVNETTTDEQLADGARWYTVTVENGSFADGEIVLTCAYENALGGFYDTSLRDVQAVYAYTDGSKTGSAVQPAKVVSASHFVVDSFAVGGGTAVEIVPGGLNTADDAESLFAGGWKRGSLPAAVDGKPAIYQATDQSATVSLKLTAASEQKYYSKTTVKCYLSDSAENYASGRLLKQTSFTAGEELGSMEALVKAHPIELTLPTQAAGVKYLTAEVTTHYAIYDKSGTVVKTHTAAIVTKAANEELYTVSADGTLTGYDGSENTMTIPARVGETDVKKVGALTEGTVYGTSEVVVSEGIKDLGDNALRNFRDLTAVTLPGSIRAVGSTALATGSSALTLRIDSADSKAPTFAADAVDLSAASLTVQCYAGSAAEAWANALKAANPDKVTVTTLGMSRMLRIEIKDSAGQILGQDSFTAVEWFREGSDTVLSRGISCVLPEDAAIGANDRYVCKVTFSPAIRWDYTVPVTMRYIFDRFGTQSYQLPPREKNITVTGSFRQDQIDDGFEAHLVMQDPKNGEQSFDLTSVTSDHPSFSVELSGRYPITLYAENASGGELTMSDVQSRPSTGGTIDLGELTLPSRNIQQTIESEHVDMPDNWRALNALVNNYGKFVLLDEEGSEFTDFTLSLRRSDQTCWLVLKLGSSVRDKYFVGDKLTLHQIPSNGIGYRLEDAEITLQLGTQTADQFDLAVKTSAMLGFYSQISSDYYVFDEAGALVCSCSWGSVYVDPGTYTVIGIRKNAFLTSLSSLAELEDMGIPAENYLKETVTLAAAKTYYAGTTPDFLQNTITLTATADEQMMANGLVPVYIQYHNQLADQFGQERDWTISINANDASHVASLPLEKLDGKYAYSTDGEIVDEDISYYTIGGYQYEQLDLTVHGAAGSICLYAEAGGRTLTIQAANTSVATKLTLPRENISMTAPERSTAQEEGTLHLYAQLSQRSGTSYVGRVYVNDVLQSEKPLSVFGMGENLLSYRLKRYSDGSASHTVRAEVWEKTGEGEERIWSSDSYHVLLLPSGENTAEPMKLSMRMFLARENYQGNLQLTKDFDLQRGNFGKVSYTLYPIDFNADNTLKNDMVLDYQLTMSNPAQVRNERVVLRVYSGSETDPTVTDLILRQNPATGTFDGTLTLEGGTYGINDVPFGYDLRYYSDTEMGISMEQLAEEIKQREVEIRSELPEESLLTAAPVDMEALEYLLLQLPEGGGEGEFTAEEKQALRDACIAHNDWCARVGEIRTTMFEELEEITGLEVSEDMTIEEMLSLIGELTGGLFSELLEEGDDLLDREYLLSHGYLRAGDTSVYIYTDITTGYTSAVDLDGRTHISVGEPPQQSRMMRSMARSSDAMDAMAPVNTMIQSVTTMTSLILEVIIERLETFALVDTRTSWEKFLDVNLSAVDNLEQVARANSELAKNAGVLQKEAQKLMQALTRFRMAMASKDLESMTAAITHVKSLTLVQKIPLSKIGTVIGLVFDVYEIYRFREEVQREINNCLTETSAAWRYASTLQTLINSGRECTDGLAAYLQDCIMAVRELETDTDDIIRTQIARLACRVQALGFDATIAALGSILPKKVEIAANVTAFAVNNVSELGAHISLVKNMHELESDWEDIQKSCIDPLQLVNCTESGDPDDGGSGSGSGGGGDGEDEGDGVPGDFGDFDKLNNGSGGGGSGRKPKVYVPTTAVIDPAGYVYEAVASNRVEGAEAKIWYRDESGNAAAWDEAPEFGETATQITGADSRFSWMTPPGKWLVTVTKTGYTAADSKNDPAAQDGWLPVPPPQLNVNIALTSTLPPEVESAQAAGDVIRVVFSQYMNAAQFADGALLSVTQNGAPVTALTVSFADEEASPADESVLLGRILELRRTDDEGFAGSVSLTIDQTAKNYAGTAMDAAYVSGALSVRPIAGSIVHSYPNRFVTDVDAEGTLAVQVLDTAGKPLAGVTVTATQQTGGTLELAETAVSDSNGRAAFAVKGLTSGYDVITFSAGTVSGTMNTRVSPLSTTAPKKPTANLSDYQVVSAGTQLVITAPAGAVIRYTTNNTCPCTEDALTYSGPIPLSETGEYFFRIAAWTQAGGYSERLNLHITVQPGSSGSGSGSSGSGSGSSGSGSAASGGTQQPGEQPAQTPQFTDVPALAYYYEAVRWAVGSGITNGVGGSRFAPDESCTRAQIVTFLWRAAGCPEPKGTSSFSDVPADAYYAKAVAWAMENGITGGVGGGRFAPDETCTRAQSAAFLYRAAGSPAVGGSATFRDVAADVYYALAVAWAAQRNITNGIGDGLFGSDLECTRAQIVTFLYRSAMAE